MTQLRKKLIRSATNDRGPPTHDKAALVADGIYVAEEIGPNMKKLPNGNLLCLNVPIARIGWMMYGPNETPIEVGTEGVAYVERREEDLFNDVTIGSIKGAAVTDEHPDDDVTPTNWKVLSRGFATTNIRRGEGDEAEVLLGDLIITEAQLIEQVLGGKRQVSLGYDADYQEIAPGVGRQTNILCNHIALVGKGRCGPRCAIGDSDYQPLTGKEDEMTTKRVKINTGGGPRRVPLAAQIASARQRVTDAESELEALESGKSTDELEEGGEGGATHIHLHVDTGKSHAGNVMTGDEKDPDPNLEEPDPNPDAGTKTLDDETEARFQSLEAGHAAIMDDLKGIKDVLSKLAGGTGDADPDEEEEEKKTGDADPDEETKDGEMPDQFKKGKTGDSASKGQDSRALENSYQNVLAQAELLVPGFRMPTFDAAMSRAKTIDRMCNARRSALTACYATSDGATLISTVTGKKDLDLMGMTCPDVASVFKAAAGAKALLNNAAQTRDSSGLPSGGKRVGGEQGGITTLADMNLANQKYWEEQSKKV